MNCTCSADIQLTSYLLIGAVGAGCVSGGSGGCVDSVEWWDDSCRKEVKVIIEAVKRYRRSLSLPFDIWSS